MILEAPVHCIVSVKLLYANVLSRVVSQFEFAFRDSLLFQSIYEIAALVYLGFDKRCNQVLLLFGQFAEPESIPELLGLKLICQAMRLHNLPLDFANENVVSDFHSFTQHLCGSQDTR